MKTGVLALADLTRLPTPEEVEEAVSSLGTTSLRGDIRDMLLAFHQRDTVLPWNRLTEADQKDIIERCNEMAVLLIEQTVRTVAGAGRREFLAELVRFTAKGKQIKAEIVLSNTIENLVLLNEAAGCEIVVAVADASGFAGQQRRVTAVKDQPEMFDEADSSGDPWSSEADVGFPMTTKKWTIDPVEVPVGDGKTRTIPLNDFVRCAQAESGLTIAEWNQADEKTRNGHLAAYMESLIERPEDDAGDGDAA